MTSRAQRFWNLYARVVQKPALAFVRPQWLARKVFSLNAMTVYRQPKGLRVTNMNLGGVSAARCQIGDTATKGTLLYFHGGAFVIGNLLGYRHLVAQLASQSGQSGIYIDYGLAPENPYPAAVDDVEAAYRALLNDPTAGPITLAGDSAGGNLVFALLLRIKRHGLPMPAACAVMSPVTDLRLQNPSLATNRRSDPLVPKTWGARGVRDYLGNQLSDMPEVSPILGDFTGCPPVFINVDQTEILYDDGRLMAAHLRAQGVDVTLVEERGLTHVWHLNVGRAPEADTSVRQIAHFLSSHLETVDSPRTPA
ncbi:alpha/beta hydrolase [Yoonia sp. R2331]|uniref:alpha/beta hydrolase n=1 Tax=Yoonia sp. R2331 TaxID=3237238 RepID=UPI0034E4BEAE